MKGFFYTLALLVVTFGFATIRVAAQVDLSGTWEFEKSSSLFLSAKSYHSRMVIKQNTVDIIVSAKTQVVRYDKKDGTSKTIFDGETTLTYFLDGRGEVNTMTDGSKIYSKTEWKGNKLLTTFFSGPADEKKKETLGTVEFSLLKDGKLLMAKKGKLPCKIPCEAEMAALQGVSVQGDSQTGMLLVAGSLTNHKDTFRLVSK